jgi:RimJ/RimL family protein N-acetyltransferase
MRALRVTARRLEFRDLPTRVEWFNESSVAQMMLMDYPASLADTELWFSSHRMSASRRDFVFDAPNISEHSIVAMGGLTDIDPRNRRAEVYIVVAPDRRRQGYGREAMIWLANYGFTVLDLSRIYLQTLGVNEPAQGMYERLGFLREGTLRQHVIHRGVPQDRALYALLKDEWRAQPWACDDWLRLGVGGRSQ